MEKSNSRTDKFVRVWGILSLIMIICLIYYIKNNNLENLFNGLVPNIIYGLTLILIFLFFPSKSYRLLKNFIDHYNQRQNNPKVNNWVSEISTSRNNFVDNFPDLGRLWDSFINERIEEIRQGADGKVEFSSETQRDSFIESVFNNLGEIPNPSEIWSMTWDYEGYFPDYWRQFSMSNKFKIRNEKAQKEGIFIKRMFIFRKDYMTEEKMDIYNRLFDNDVLTSNTSMKWIYEDDLKSEDYERYKIERSSFLLLIDRKGEVKILTQNFQLESFMEEKKSNALFLRDVDAAKGHKNRFELLYEQGSSDKLVS